MVMRICETRHVDRLPPSDGFEGTSISFVGDRVDFTLEGDGYTLVRDSEMGDAYCDLLRGDRYLMVVNCDPFPGDIVVGDADGNGTEDLIVEGDGGYLEYLTAEWWEPLCDRQARAVEEEYQRMMDWKLPMWQRRKAAETLVHYEIEHRTITRFFIELSEKPEFYPDDVLSAAEYFENAGMIEEAFEIYLSVAKDTDLARDHRTAAKASACSLIGVTLE